jgi:hypothetical protein
VRRWLKPLLVPLLRRDEGEIARRIADFRIDEPAGQVLVARLGSAFLGGYNAMLRQPSLGRVVEEGRHVAPHYRPFFFEGAAMGYLPRGYYTSGCSAGNAERALLGLDRAFLYLYYVGLGFWIGFRHPRHPERIVPLAAHLDPLYAPLCYDGFGFKVGFFDFDGDPAVTRVFERCPDQQQSFAYQGFGRALFFVYMDDELGFRKLKKTLPAERSTDLELGRSLACGFTGVDRPAGLVSYIRDAADAETRAARLVGVTWALTARRMNDARYFASCLEGGGAGDRALLCSLPDLCDAERDRSTSYTDWQARTREAVERVWPL